MLVPSGEAIVETKSCKSCGISFAVTDSDMEFYDRLSPVFAGHRETLPTPTLCPDCRQRRRLVWRNERKLYRRKCDMTGRDVVSIYSPDKLYKVYHPDAWWSDGWDALSYGREFDFSRTFAEQYEELFAAVPRKSLNQKWSNENSEYCNIIKSLKDCYLTFAATECEGMAYSNWLSNCSHSLDISYGIDMEDSYECVDSEKCLSSRHLRGCKKVSHSAYLSWCEWCHHCFWCVNLHDKSYHILNEPLSPEEYERRLREIEADPAPYLRAYVELLAKLPRRDIVSLGNEDTSGSGIFYSKSVHHAYDIYDAQDCRYVFDWFGGVGLMDFYEFFDDCQHSYEWQEMGKVSFSAWNNSCYGADHVYYTFDSYSCSHLFACVGLRHKQYCILNKQYTEEEYNTLVPKIISHMRKTGEWGEFFSPSLSPFGYNETVAMEYYPLSKEEAIAQGFNWSDYEAPFPKVEKIIPANKLPENIKDIPDDILNWAIECEVTRKPYRIIKQELEFYRKHSLPIPRRHPDQRHLDRLALRNPRKLHERKCDNCFKPITTTYAPDRPERVYCEECYRREVYG